MKCPHCFKTFAAKAEMDDNSIPDEDRCWVIAGGDCWADNTLQRLVPLAAGDGAKPPPACRTASGPRLMVFWVQRGDQMHRIEAGSLEYAFKMASDTGDDFILWSHE